MVEDPGDGAMLDSQLGGRAANLYKPDGPGADFTKFDKEGFSKKTNEDEANFADVEVAIAALQAPRNNPASGGRSSNRSSTSITSCDGWR